MRAPQKSQAELAVSGSNAALVVLITVVPKSEEAAAADRAISRRADDRRATRIVLHLIVFIPLGHQCDD